MRRSGGPGRTGLASSSRRFRLCRSIPRRSLSSTAITAGWRRAAVCRSTGGRRLSAPIRALSPGWRGGRAWIWSKLGLVLLLTVFHGLLERWRRDFAAGRNARRARFYRIVNELPTLAMIAIVILVVVKPF